MNSNSFKVIVLHTFRYKESGIIVRGYDSSRGICSLFLRGSSRSKGKNSSQLHPLAIIEGNLIANSKGEMRSIKEFEVVCPLKSIRGSVVKGSIAFFLSELISKTVREVEPNSQLFSFLESSILQFEQCSKGVANFHPWFTTHFTGLLGYLPNIPPNVDGMQFEINSARYVKVGEGKGSLFSQKESQLLWQLYNADITQLEEIKITGEQRSSFLNEMMRYLTYHTGDQIECNTLPLLRQLFIE